MLGVCDYEKQKQVRYSHDSNGNAWLFFGAGPKYPGNIAEGKAWGVGDLVEVVVNIPDRSLTCNVNGVYSAKWKDVQALADASRTFMPYIELNDQNDCIEWHGGSY